MISDRAEKTSLAGSVLVHAAVVLAVFALVGAVPEGKGKTLWVDVIEAPAGPLVEAKGGKSVESPRGETPESTTSKLVAPPAPQEEMTANERTVVVPADEETERRQRPQEGEPAPAVESISFEARAFHREGPSLEVSEFLRKETGTSPRSAPPRRAGAPTGVAPKPRDVPVEAYLASTGGPQALRQGGAGGSLSQSDRRALIGRIQASIQDALMYPPLARRRGMEGTVEAVFVIDSHGMPRNIRVLRSSGYRILDKQALRTIQKASPYPVLESAVEIPITFRLTKD
jgi:protein TonB